MPAASAATAPSKAWAAARARLRVARETAGPLHRDRDPRVGAARLSRHSRPPGPDRDAAPAPPAVRGDNPPPASDRRAEKAAPLPWRPGQPPDRPWPSAARRTAGRACPGATRHRLVSRAALTDAAAARAFPDATAGPARAGISPGPASEAPARQPAESRCNAVPAARPGPA